MIAFTKKELFELLGEVPGETLLRRRTEGGEVKFLLLGDDFPCAIGNGEGAKGVKVVRGTGKGSIAAVLGIAKKRSNEDEKTHAKRAGREMKKLRKWYREYRFVSGKDRRLVGE